MSEPLADIQHEIAVNAPIARVWRVMTEPASVSGWLGCLQYEKKLGHVFYMQPDRTKSAAGDVTGATHCEILALDEPALFKFSWYLPGLPKTAVEFRLQDAGAGRTRVAFAHSGWTQFNAADIRHIWEMLSQGWTSHVLPGLQRVAEEQV